MVAIIAILAWLVFYKDFDCFGIDFTETAFKAVDIVSSALIWISTALTVISGCVYLKGYWHLIDSDK
jgi:CDP-diacylglycerol--glycerol-3-phosphate 3-phosphatidyltransferase